MNTSQLSSSVVAASVWQRAIARLIDLTALVALAAAAMFAAHKLQFDRFPIPDGIVLSTIVAYEFLFPWFSGGASLGRVVARTRIVRENGSGRPSVLQYGARLMTRVALYALFAVFIAYEIDLESFALVCVIEAVVATIQRRHQSLADLTARTVVARAHRLAPAAA